MYEVVLKLHTADLEMKIQFIEEDCVVTLDKIKIKDP